MKIHFRKCMLQRYRAICHLIDPLIDSGHELSVTVTSNLLKMDSFHNTPCDVDTSSSNGIRYVADNFGITMKHFDKVEFTKKKNVKCDLELCYDNHNKDALGIPYNTYHCFKAGTKYFVGNPLCESIRDSAAKEEKGTLLVVHPGGGRGYISPQRVEMSKEKVTRNNIIFFQKVLDNLPSAVHTVTIKTHPFPYRRCTKSAIEKFVVPHLKFHGTIRVADTGMIDLIAGNEYIINFGGTTAIWLRGSGKQWFNIKGTDMYKASREKLVEARGGGITLRELKGARSDRGPDAVFGMDATVNIMKVIHETLDYSCFSK